MTNAFILYDYMKPSEEEVVSASIEFRASMDKRRSIRDFSDEAVPREVILNLLMTAASAPSGANKQPWTFCAISDLHIKRQIKEAAEKEEYINYHGRMSEDWLQDLNPLGTDWHKDFLEIAPWLIVIFKRSYDKDESTNRKNYYVNESVGIAAGFLLSAIHQAGLVTLTHTPSPMNFLSKILDRPENEKPFLLLPVGYPAKDAMIPDIKRKGADEVIKWIE